MSSRWRIGLLAALFCVPIAGLAVASLYLAYGPAPGDSFKKRQLEIAQQKDQLKQQAAKLLPQVLPNAAPEAAMVEGPAGKILPIRLVWQDARGSTGGVLEDFDGCIMAGPGIDVFWHKCDLFVMKQQGALRRVWTAFEPNRRFGMTDHAFSPPYVCYDGKYVWAPLGGGFEPTRLIVLDPLTEQTWELGAEDAPRDLSRKPANNRSPRLALAPWAPGKVVAAGWPGQPWLVVLGFDPQQGKSVQPLPEPIDLEQKRNDLLAAGEQQLTPAGMWMLSERGASGAQASRRLLLGRERPPQFESPMWSVDPPSARFELVGGPSLTEAIAQNRLARGSDALYWIEHAPAENPRTVLVRAKLPDFTEQVVLMDVPDGHPTFHEDWLWSVGDSCWRWKPGDEQVEAIQVDVPWKFGFRADALDPPEKKARNDVYYSIREAYPSQHYGLLVTTSRRDTNAIHTEGKFFQFGLADDPRLKPATPGGSPAAKPPLAADAAPGTIVSLLELVAPSDTAEGGRPIAVLGPAIEVGDIPEDVGLPILSREIVRQALLLAARNRLGWLTRDAVLRETLPDEKREAAAQFILSMRFPYQAPAEFELSRLDPQGKAVPLWKEKLEIFSSGPVPCEYQKLIQAAERWSREAFPPLLEQAGLPRGAGEPPSGGKIPATAEQQLEQMTFTAQFAALRELHEALRRQGNSPALVGAVVRGYANLGVLTEYHWTAVHKVCKARALLYAQQLVAAEPESAWALWHRAYAEALTGIHRAAQDDLAAADKLAQESGAGTPPERPDWLDLISAFCRFDDEKLGAVAGDARYAQLAGLLQFLVVERLKHSEPVQQLMEKVLAKNPECFRVHDARSSSNELGTLHEATLVAPAVLEETVPKRLREMQGLPSDAASLLERDERRAGLLADLADMLSATGPDEDGDELSFRMLGGLIQETQFIQFWRRTRFLRNQLAAPADEYVLAVAPLAGGHRYHALLDLYLSTPQPQAAAELMERLDLSELDFESLAEFKRVLGSDWETRHTEQYLAAAKRPEQHMDDVHHDFLAMLATFDNGENKEGEHPNRDAVRRMRKVSPDSPDAAAFWIGLRERELYAEIPALEKKFARSPQVWQALAYAQYDQKDERIRRLRKCIELSHESWAYLTLAGIYHQDRDYEQFVAVLKEFLDQPERGLEHDHVRAQLAGHYMRQKEFDKALPYAVEAAESWAKWGMLTAADCYEGLGDYQNEGLWRERIAERYPSQANSLVLYFWACRSGLGEKQTLEQQLDPAMSIAAEEAPSRQQHQIGAFYQLSGRPDKALAAYQKAAQDRSELRLSYTAQLRAALVAHQQGNAEAREQALSALTAIRDPGLAAFQKLGAWLERNLSPGKESTADLAAARNIVQDADPQARPALNYAIGRCLELRGQADDANAFLDAAASDPVDGAALSRVLASAALRARGVIPSKIKIEPAPTGKADDKGPATAEDRSPANK